MLSDIFNNLDWSVVTDVITSVIPALICITFHELAHGFSAYALGDRTAKDMGRLTFNPVKHIDVFGLIMMVIFKFGWAKPVPVNMNNFKKPKWHMALTAFAGPLSNIILAVIVLFIFWLVYTPLSAFETNSVAGIILSMIYLTAYISVALAVFNLLPIPPLDGSKVLFALLPSSGYRKLMQHERYGMIVLFAFLSIDSFLNMNIFGATIGQFTGKLFDSLLYFTSAAHRIAN
ncbi:MAG: site-2 protease family protein [Oscillospiraceae bacterium]|nr:site-2 protease family protein [Oscillospiraceae bacterium]